MMKSSFCCYNIPASFPIHPLLSEPWGRWWRWGSWRWRSRWWCRWPATWWGTCPALTPSSEAPLSAPEALGGHSTSHWSPSPCSSRWGSRQGSLATGGAEWGQGWVGSGSRRVGHRIRCHTNLKLILLIFKSLTSLFLVNLIIFFNFLLCHLGSGAGGLG